MGIIKLGFIPLRKGSKGIRNKNKKKLLGRPLYTWVLTEAIFSDLDQVIVYTDDEEIIAYTEKQYRWTPKVICVKRGEKGAVDTASTETAILEFCNAYEHSFDVFCLLQATSPLTTRAYINQSVSKITTDHFDASLTVVKTHKFIWDAEGKSLNYNIFDRPRRQDFEGLLIENGAIYCTKKSALLKHKNRLSGKIAVVEMPDDTLTEIDTVTDWTMVEQLLTERLIGSKENKKIKLFVLDVDGVFTDGCVWYDKNGEMAKKFSMRDGMGLEILREHGVDLMVITSEDSEIVKQRMQKLNIKNAYFNVKDKYALLEKYMIDNKIVSAEIAYIGDDENDLSNMMRVGWSFCPGDATKKVKYYADVELKNKASDEAIREATEFIIKYNKRF